MAKDLKDKTLDELLSWQRAAREIANKYNILSKDNTKFLKYNGLLNKISAEIEKRINEEFF